MTKRYFSATDGTFTIFRASEWRTYSHGKFLVSTKGYDHVNRCPITIAAHPRQLGFTNRPGRDTVPAVEITEAEYAALNARKRERQACEGNTYSTSPQSSWVRNSQLEG